MTTILTIVHVLVSFFLVGIVLLQQGKGADMGAAFGGGSSQTVFGADGPVSLLGKVTTAAAIIFMITSLTLAYQSSHKTSSVMTDVTVSQDAKKEVTEEPKPQLIETKVAKEAEASSHEQGQDVSEQVINQPEATPAQDGAPAAEPQANEVPQQEK